MNLTDKACKQARAKEKTYAVYDINGLYLEIFVNGKKYWRFSYSYFGKQKRVALGVYPEVTLAEARVKRDEARKLIKNGEDPALLRKQTKIETKENIVNSFENIAREWFSKKEKSTVKRYSFYVIRRLEANMFPFLGGIPIKKITSKELLAVIRKIEERGSLIVAKKILQIVGQIFRYAIATGRAEHNIAADLRGALHPAKTNHFPHFSEKEFQEFLGKFFSFRGNVLTKHALHLLILTFVRSGELRGASWEEFDFDKREWRIPAERMKMKEQHIVPLSGQSIQTLEEIRKFSDGKLLFPNRSNDLRTISDNTLSKAFRDQGYRGIATPHGMRATASTILNEHGFKADVIDISL